jgi:hypothetical protein
LEADMEDVIYLALGTGLFAAMALFARVCTRL